MDWTEIEAMANKWKEDAVMIEKELMKLIPENKDRIPNKDRLEIKQKILELGAIVIEQSGAYKMLQCIMSIKDKEKEKEKEKTEIITYADITKSTKIDTGYKMTIENKSNNKTEVKKIILQKIDPVKSGLQINKIRSTKEGKTIIECKSKQQIEKLQNQLENEMGEEIITRIIEKNKSRVIYKNLHLDTKPEEFLDIIYTQNKEINSMYPIQEDFNNEVEIIHSYIAKTKKGKGGEYVNIILELKTQKVRKALNREIGIIWQKRTAEKSLNILRCFKCQGYGHKTTNCRELKDRCSECAGEHRYKDCNNRGSKVCANCNKENNRNKDRKQLETNHSAFDSEYQMYLKYKEKIENRIDYG